MVLPAGAYRTMGRGGRGASGEVTPKLREAKSHINAGMAGGCGAMRTARWLGLSLSGIDQSLLLNGRLSDPKFHGVEWVVPSC